MSWWSSKLEEISSGVRDALHVLAKHGSALHALQQDLRAQRATLDQLLLQMQKQGEQQIGIAALLEGEVETQEEREQREKAEEEFDLVRDILARMEEV